MQWIFLGVKITSLIRFIHLIMQEHDSKCREMYLITLKVSKSVLRQSPKSVKGSQIHLALAHWKWHTPRVEKLCKAPRILSYHPSPT
jgi:hypothetical protein